jgi:hypothetical protein
MAKPTGVRIVSDPALYTCPVCRRFGAGSHTTHFCPKPNHGAFTEDKPTIGPDGLPSSQACPTQVEGGKIACGDMQPALSFVCTVCRCVTAIK